MKIIAINGSPRKNWNTATLLNKAIEGAASKGAETELIHLYSLKYRGCISCFSCKRKDGEHGRCSAKDDLTPLLEKLKTVDTIVLGSPIYFMTITSGMSAFLERFLFSNFLYDTNLSTAFPKKIQSGIIYTMNVTEQQMEDFEIKKQLRYYEQMLGRILGKTPKILYSCNTYQFDNYDNYVSSYFSEKAKAKHKAEQFPIDCEKAFNMGVELVNNA